MCRIITKTGIKVNGKVLVPCEYDNIMPAIVDGEESKELFLTMDNGKMGIIKIDKKDSSYKKMPSQYHNVGKFNNGIAIISTYDDRFGYRDGLITDDLKEVLHCEYYKIELMSNTLFAVYNENGNVGVFNVETRSMIIPIKFSHVAYDEKEQKIVVKM